MKKFLHRTATQEETRRLELFTTVLVLIGSFSFLLWVVTRPPIPPLPPASIEPTRKSIHGIGVPIQDTNPKDWTYDNIPFFTWDSEHCHRRNFIPLVWSKERPPDECQDGRVLLLFNEPEYPSQSNLEPAVAAGIAKGYRDWTGAVFCCGNLWLDRGFDWMQEFIEEMGDDIDIIDGLHMHAYGLYPEQVPKWASLAYDHKWLVIVSEWAVGGGTPNQYDELRLYLEKGLQPIFMFIFSWKYHLLPEMDLVDGEGNLTGIGEWWFEMKDSLVPAARESIFLPYIRL